MEAQILQQTQELSPWAYTLLALLVMVKRSVVILTGTLGYNFRAYLWNLARSIEAVAFVGTLTFAVPLIGNTSHLRQQPIDGEGT